MSRTIIAPTCLRGQVERVAAPAGVPLEAWLTDLAHAGVLVLLFSVGLKLRLKSLARPEVLAGGVSRNTLLRKPHPFYVERGEGCRVVDIDGVERIDFANNMASLIHGPCRLRIAPGDDKYPHDRYQNTGEHFIWSG